MKKVVLILTMLVGFLGIVERANAHAIWIESNVKATKNKAHQVKVFYGEYPEGEVEQTAKWYSDLKTLEVWAISPSKKKTKLSLSDAGDHLIGSFTPAEDGVYYIATVHTTKDLGGTTKYEFSSLLPVASGNTAQSANAPEQSFAIISTPKTYKANEPLELKIWKDGKVFVGGEVSIMSPDGWVKKVKTNDKGEVKFSPILKGKYIIEASEYKEESGEWNQKQYTHTWKASTTSIIVN